MHSDRRDDRSGVARCLAAEEPPREPEAVRALARRARRDPAARERLVLSNLRLAARVAWMYRDRGVPVDDLFQEGIVGLLESVRRFDDSRDTQFSTYATWWIRKYVLEALRDAAGPVRVPSYRRRKLRGIEETSRALRGVLKRDPIREEIASRLSMPVEEIDRLLRERPRRADLESPIGAHDTATLADRIADDRHEAPDEALLSREARRCVREALCELPVRDRYVLSRRMGFDGSEPLTFREIADGMRLSRERVRQLEREAISRLRARVVRQGPLP